MPNKFNELLLKPDIIELYNEGITPDYGYLMNGRFEKDMVKTLYPLKALSGNPISWEASDTEYLFPVVSLEPKQAGSGDPSPENIRPVSGWDKVQVTRCGKNLIDVSKIDQSIPGETLGTSISVNFPVSITISANYSAATISENIWRFKIEFLDGSLQYATDDMLNGTSNTHATFNGTQENPITSITYRGTYITSGEISNVMCNIGSTPTPYEPYQGDTYDIALPETIYGGTVDAVTGVGSKEWFTAILTGHEEWYSWGSNRPNSFYTDIVGHKNLANNAINVFCSNFLYDNGNDRYTPYHFFSQNPGSFPDNVRLCFTFDETVTNVDLAKQWISAQSTAGTPVTVCYKLANPESFQATGNQQLTSLLGYNTINTDGDSMVLSRKARRLEV